MIENTFSTGFLAGVLVTGLIMIIFCLLNKKGDNNEK